MSQLTDYTEHLLKEHWRPCGLDDDMRRELLKIQSNELRKGKKWKINLAQFSVEKATNQALALAKKWKKSECHYLNMALKNKWVTNFYKSMAE